MPCIAGLDSGFTVREWSSSSLRASNVKVNRHHEQAMNT